MPVNIIAVYGPEALDARLNIMQPVMRIERQSVLWPLIPRVLRMKTAIIVSADPLRPQPPKYRREVEFCGPNMARPPPLPQTKGKVLSLSLFLSTVGQPRCWGCISANRRVPRQQTSWFWLGTRTMEAPTAQLCCGALSNY